MSANSSDKVDAELSVDCDKIRHFFSKIDYQLINRLKTKNFGEKGEFGSDLMTIVNYLKISLGIERKFEILTSDEEQLASRIKELENGYRFILIQKKPESNYFVSMVLVVKNMFKLSVFIAEPSKVFNKLNIESILNGHRRRLEVKQKFIPESLEMNEVDASIYSLYYFQTFVNEYKKQLEYFSRYFESFELNDENSCESWLKKLGIKIQVDIFHCFVSILNEDEEFKKSARNFVNQSSPLLALSKKAKEYHEILKKVQVGEATQADVKKVRNELFKEENFSNIIKMSEEKPAEGSNFLEKFGESSKIFRNIFGILFNAEPSEKRSKAIKLIEELLELNSGTLEEFFKENLVKKDEEKNDEDIFKISVDNIAVKSVKSEVVEQGVKSLDELLNESEIESSKSDLSFKNILRESFEKVKMHLNNWKDKSKEEIFEWAINNKGKVEDPHEAIAVMNRANSLVTGWFSLRDTQILSVLAYYHGDHTKGTFLQIQTGEGKTAIISLLAVLKILMGKKFVDVVTTNMVLAEEAIESRKNFYNMFNISVDVIKVDSSGKTGPRDCYKADVVYGTMSHFQSDYLRHHFEGFDVLGKREICCMILDEVDSMLLDNGGHITKLASPFPSMDYLKYIHIKIWQELIKAEAKVTDDIIQQTEAKKKEVSAQDLTSNQKIKAVLDFQNVKFSKYTELLTKYIKESNPHKIDIIPVHLRAYARSTLDDWIQSAIYARYQCHENRQYIIREKDGEKVLIPVDYENTGVTMKNTVWSKGLHQFVQLKHNLEISNETLTSSFISNIGYVKLYNNNLIGLTGTLGSDNEYALMSQVYHLNYGKIPTYKYKRFNEEQMIVLEDNDWLDTVAVNAFERAKNKRSVLIICQTINDVNDIVDTVTALKKLRNFSELKIKTYVDETQSKTTEEKVGKSEIIVATNIAGRGTDFKTTKDLEALGGLHVCVSFLPVNQRVQDQAFGRTSRQGKSGSAQMIIRKSETQNMSDNLIESRNKSEEVRLNLVKQKHLPEVEFRDKIFEKFKVTYKNFRGAGSYTQPVAKDLKECWAFWLAMELKSVTEKNVEEEFEKFLQKAETILKGKKISFNPFYCLEEAENYLYEEKYFKAKKSLKHALSLSSSNNNLLHSIHIKLFESEMQENDPLKGRILDALSKIVLFNYSFIDSKRYKENALKHLRNAINSLRREVDYLNRNYFSEEDITADFKEIIVDDSKENHIIRQIYSRFISLKMTFDHLQSLHDQMKDDGDNHFAITSRIPQFLKNFESDNDTDRNFKSLLSNKELDDLQNSGLDVFYSLRTILNVNSHLIEVSRWELVGAFAAVFVGFVFPPVMGASIYVAAILLSEIITNIVVEVLMQGYDTFNLMDYLKDKGIELGLAIFSAGLSKLATVTKMVTQVTKVFQRIKDLIMKCKILKKVFIAIAKIAAKFSNIFAKIKVFFDHKVVKVTFLMFQKAGSITMKYFVKKIIIEKRLERIFGPLRDIIMKNAQKMIDEKLDKEGTQKITKKRLYELSNEIILNIMDGDLVESITETFKDVEVLEFIGTISEGILNIRSMTTFIDEFVGKFNEIVRKDETIGSFSHNFEEFAKFIGEHFYDIFVDCIIELLQTIQFFVEEALSFVIDTGAQYGKLDSIMKDNRIVEAPKVKSTWKQLAEAYDTLGVDSSAKEDKVNDAFKKAVIRSHSDLNINHLSSDWSNIKKARDLILKNLNAIDTSMN